MKPVRICLGLALLALLLRSSLANAEESFLYRARVAVPVADLRAEPGEPGPMLEHDPLEESQLLYGDLVEVLEEKEGWARVRAPAQQEWTHHERWEGYPGWMERSALLAVSEEWKPNLMVRVKLGRIRQGPQEEAPVRWVLSIGSSLAGEEKEDWYKLRLLDGSIGWIMREEVRSTTAWVERDIDSDRRRIVEAVRPFLGDPYYWGGRSAHLPAVVGPPHTATDCSGLVGLVYQANGFAIPRDAHEQWMKARRIAREELQPADLVFLSDPEKPDRISHVALYAGDGKVIEGPGTGERVREISLEERLRQAGKRRVWFGSYW